jgi:hypothetical protein
VRQNTTGIPKLLGLAYLGSVLRNLQHHRAVSELLDQTILSLDGCNDVKNVDNRSWFREWNILAYEISATLSLLKQFQRWLPRLLTNWKINSSQSDRFPSTSMSCYQLTSIMSSGYVAISLIRIMHLEPWTYIDKVDERIADADPDFSV